MARRRPRIISRVGRARHGRRRRSVICRQNSFRSRSRGPAREEPAPCPPPAATDRRRHGERPGESGVRRGRASGTARSPRGRCRGWVAASPGSSSPAGAPIPSSQATPVLMRADAVRGDARHRGSGERLQRRDNRFLADASRPPWGDVRGVVGGRGGSRNRGPPSRARLPRRPAMHRIPAAPTAAAPGRRRNSRARDPRARTSAARRNSRP